MRVIPDHIALGAWTVYGEKSPVTCRRIVMTVIRVEEKLVARLTLELIAGLTADHKILAKDVYLLHLMAA